MHHVRILLAYSSTTLTRNIRIILTSISIYNGSYIYVQRGMRQYHITVRAQQRAITTNASRPGWIGSIEHGAQIENDVLRKLKPSRELPYFREEQLTAKKDGYINHCGHCVIDGGYNKLVSEIQWLNANSRTVRAQA